MSDAAENSDGTLMDLLRKRGGLSVAELSELMGVTATAVRQRVSRLMAGGLLERELVRSGRGRPNHRYLLSEKGRRHTGANFADLAMVLWEEVRSIDDSEVRRGLLQRISKRLAEMYADEIEGETSAERMEALVRLFGERQVPLEVDTEGDLPILKALACPYTEIAEQDRSICAMERQLFSELVGEGLRLSECRLDGQTCCTFELN